MWLTLVLLVVVLFVIRTVQINVQRNRRGLSGPLLLPFVGSALTAAYRLSKYKNGIEGRYHLFASNFEHYGDTWYNQFLSVKLVATRDPKVVKHVTTDNFETYKRWLPEMYKDFGWKSGKDLFGDGIFLTDDEIWAIQRKAATPLFKKNSLDFMKLVFNEKAVTFCNIMKEFARSKEVFDIQAYYMKYTLDSFGKIGFGTEFHSLHENPKEVSFASHFDTTQSLLSRFFWEVSSRFGQVSVA